MKTYILFAFINFQNVEDIKYFCYEHFPQFFTGKLQFILISSGVIILFNSEKTLEEIKEDVDNGMFIDETFFYLLFEHADILHCKLPEQIESVIKSVEFKNLNTEFFDNTNSEEIFSFYNLDDILEKIKVNGIESLTSGEKNFLENFDK